MKDLAKLTLDWAVRSFGAEHVYNKSVRALRLAEEAIELAQALGVSREKMHEQVDAVFNRPVGEPWQEMGGVMVTATILCLATFSHYPDEALFDELRRVLEKSPEHFAKRNEEKIKLGLA